MNKINRIVLLLGDIAVLYTSLLLALWLRYGNDFYVQFTNKHVLPFSIVFLFWIVVFYIAGLYDLHRLRNNLEFFKVLSLALSINVLLAVSFFYLIPLFGIAPRIILFLFIAIFATLEIFWRRYFNKFTATLEPSARVVLIGKSESTVELAEFLGKNRQLGYEVTLWLKDETLPSSLEEISGWRTLIRDKHIDLVVVPHNLKKESRLVKLLYELLVSGIDVRDLPSFYEENLRKVPLSEITEDWLLENVSGRHLFYDNLKRATEFLLALALLILLLPLEILIAIAVKISSRGPVVYKQIRVGKNGKNFVLYKFRDMGVRAEEHGAQWKTSGVSDPRLTWAGKILVPTHLDELLQLINILKGEMSFVGPRPERPEFVKVLEKDVPFYHTRHLVNPGVTGWAQINYRYGASVEEAAHKLEYDIYYLKHRSVILDVAIVLKTIRSFFVNQI